MEPSGKGQRYDIAEEARTVSTAEIDSENSRNLLAVGNAGIRNDTA